MKNIFALILTVILCCGITFSQTEKKSTSTKVSKKTAVVNKASKTTVPEANKSTKSKKTAKQPAEPEKPVSPATPPPVQPTPVAPPAKPEPASPEVKGTQDKIEQAKEVVKEKAESEIEKAKKAGEDVLKSFKR